MFLINREESKFKYKGSEAARKDEKKGNKKNKRDKNFIILKQMEEAQKKYEPMKEVAKKGCTYALYYINEIINEVKVYATTEKILKN